MSVFILGIALGGCGKDGEDAIEINHFEYKGVDYAVSQGAIVNEGKFDGTGYLMNVAFISSSFTMVETDGVLDSLRGIGNGIGFPLYSSSSDKLAIGTYQYDETSSENSGTFDDGSFILNYNVSTDEGTEVFIEGGTVTVKQNDTEYEITFDCTTDTGEKVTGYYKGVLNYYDEQ